VKQKMTFEKAIAKLEEIVAQMETGELTLEESLKLFEEGSALSSLCYHKLSEAEQKVREIEELNEREGTVDESN
jgi:exodeoxyribonuclease VII small subunit